MSNLNETKGEEVTITKAEYDKLVEAYWFLNMLRNHGVDNWSGYGEAMEEWHETN